ncbi:MAG: Ig-like domain-containing protein, partial [Lachnospiraceae bacterium]|nr:Ig-like domain-containing protein [Lachnospiraceae bacterium]
LLWRIDLGVNILSGAHYTQYQVWDYDGDGKAEIICKTADGTTTYNENLAETGHVGAVSMADLDISEAGTPDEYDFRQHTGRLGRIVLGEEYLTAFDGETGEIIDTVNYVPFRGEYNEKTGTYDTSYWGLKNGAPAEKNDGYANRADRFLSATAYLDGGSASAVFCRGYYGRTAITAWKLIDDELVMQWAFDVDSGEEYSAQGNHGLSVNDVDGDGLDEIIYAAMVLNSDGTPRVNTEWGHGDALHVSDWDGDGELEVYKVNEEVYGAGLYDPNTGEIQWFEDGSGDTGRGVAADVDPRYEGAEMWHSIDSHTHDVDGDIIYEAKPSQNFSIFWDGDLLMELLDSNNTTDLALQVQKWNYVDLTTEVLLDETDTMLNNGTKANAGLVADIYGDWREEILVRDANDSSKLRLYSTTCETPYSFPTFLEDRAYREGVAWQNVGYNQPANVTYLLSQGIEPAVITNIDRTTSTETLTWDAADDGAYGMPIEGYEIYRADSAAALWADYELVGTVAGNTLTFTDTGLTANTEYTYIVAAVIGGETSYKSLPESAKTTVAAEGVQPVEPITLVQDDAAYTDKFPATVVVVDTEGNEEIVDITWDYSTLEIETDGEKTVYGAIYGYEELIPVQVTVLKNKITSVEVAEEVYTLVGTEPQLPAAATLKMYNNIDASAAVTWNKTYDISAVGSYEITGTVTSKYGEEKTITLTVHVADDYVVSV